MRNLFLVCVAILLAVTSCFAESESVLYNTQNSFIIPWPATDRTDFKTAETGLTAGTYVVKAYKRNKAPQTLTLTACVFATSTLTNTGNPANNETLTIAGTLNGTAVSEVKTFKSTLTGAADEIKIAATATLTFDNVKCAINDSGCTEGTDYGTGTVASQLVNATTKTATTLVIVSNIPGTGPNAYTTAETSTVLSWTAGTLASGTDTCISQESQGRNWFAGAATLFDTYGPLKLTFNYDAEALPFEYIVAVKGQSAWNAQYVSVASNDDLLETDCSTIANTNSPFYKECVADTLTKLYSVWKNPTTIATLSSQTSFTLTDGSADNDAYKDWLILVVDSSTPLQMAKGVVSAYTGSTKTVTLRTNPAVFTMAAGDAVYLMPDAALKPATDGRSVVVDAAGLADATAVKVGPTGAATAQTAGDIYTRLGAPAGASMSADIAAIKAETANVAGIKTKTDFLPSATAGAAGGVFIAGTNAATTVTTAFTTTFTGNLTGSVASVTGAVGSVTGAVGSVTGAVGSVTGTIGGLTAAALKDFFDTDSTTNYGAAVAGSVVKEMADNAGGSALTVPAIVSGVWDAATASYQIAGSTGKALTTASSAGDPWATATGGYGAGTFGKVVTDNLNAPVASASALATAQTAITDLQSRTPAALVSGRMDASVGAMQAGVLTAASIDGDAFTAAKFAADVSTEFAATLMATPYEGAETFKHFLQYGASALFGKYNSSAGTFNFRDLADTKNRIVYTTSSTARTAVTLSPD